MTSLLVARIITSLVLAIPPTIGLYALFGLDRFRRGAFGLYAQGAAALMLAIGAGLVYYVLVVALLWRQGSMQATWDEPLGPTGLMLILQSLAAAATLAALGAATRKFLAIVEPGAR